MSDEEVSTQILMVSRIQISMTRPSILGLSVQSKCLRPQHWDNMKFGTASKAQSPLAARLLLPKLQRFFPSVGVIARLSTGLHSTPDPGRAPRLSSLGLTCSLSRNGVPSSSLVTSLTPAIRCLSFSRSRSLSAFRSSTHLFSNSATSCLKYASAADVAE